MPELNVSPSPVVPAAQPSAAGETVSPGDPAAGAPGADFAAVLAERFADSDVLGPQPDPGLNAADDGNTRPDPAASPASDALASQLGALVLPPFAPMLAEARAQATTNAMPPARDTSPVASTGRRGQFDSIEAATDSVSDVESALRVKGSTESGAAKGTSLPNPGAESEDGARTHALPGVHEARLANAALTHAPQQPIATVTPSAQPGQVPMFTVPEPVAAPAWRDAVAERVTVMVREKIAAAELHVHPPELGPVSVRIDVQGSTATVVFAAQHPDTRNALQNALPQLSDALAAGGLQLADAQVGHGFASRDGNHEGGSSAFGAARVESAASPAALGARRISVGLVDVFA